MADGQHGRQTRRTWLAGLSASVAGGLFALWIARGCSEDAGAPSPRNGETVEQAKERVYAALGLLEENGFKHKGPPKSGEWLAVYKEPAQTMERYRAEVRVRPTEKRRTVVLQPLGELNEEQKKVVEAMREYAEVFFQLPARVEPPLELTLDGKKEPLFRKVPLGNRHGTYDEQCNAEKVLDKILLPELPQDAVAYLGITMADLYVPDMNYVFGLGSFNRRVGVYSLCRYFPEFWGQARGEGDELKALTRACKVLNHETGHMFSLSHCIFYECSMNGSNHLNETDAAPLHFCPLCHRKLLWNIGFDATKRYEGIAAFYRQQGMTGEAEWVAGRLERWKKIVEQEDEEKGKLDEP